MEEVGRDIGCMIETFSIKNIKIDIDDKLSLLIVF
jgi:hypothetical protein